MKKKLILVFLVTFICLTGCSKEKKEDTTPDFTDMDIEELKEIVATNSEELKSLKETNEILSEKVNSLEAENKNLKEKITSLEETDKNLKTTDSSNYNELKKLITSSSSSNPYTITKKQLTAKTWYYEKGDEAITFKPESTEVIGNWIIMKRNDNTTGTLYYMYKDGKLYTSDDGWMLTQK